jgi:diguanylate cyclase (GGDEF)-like protein/PAS domain S-box-containing protein
VSAAVRVSESDRDVEPATLLAVRDITEGYAAQQGLLLGRRAMEASASGILIVDALDPKHPLIYVNPAFERITGYRRGEALGRNCKFLQGSDRDQPELQTLREALARGHDVNVALRNYRKDGTLFWNELSISPVRNGAGVVTHFVGIQNDITERRVHEAEVLRRSSHDELTDLPNRALLLDRLREALALARRHGRMLAALLIDLDQFREINDSLGHDKGDEVLFEAAVRLRACLRDGDTLARLGGDEFMVLLPDLARPEDAAPVAERILQAIARPHTVAGRAIHCSCSIGVAFAEHSLDEPEQLVQRADLAMHAAKRAGRNTVRVYSGELAPRGSDRLEMRAQLQGAIARGEFELHYQPQLDLQGHRISGVEALVRWRHPELGQLAPERFIPVAEETGQIVPLGGMVMEQACVQHRRWVDRGLLDCPVAVNVSALQFRREDFVDTVAAVLARTGLPARRLELELTESVMMDAGARTLETLHRLRSLGVSLSIDDFGTGFSSLGYLKRLPIDKVKIDRSFVKDITHDGGDAAITLSVIAMAHHLRLRVIAEGVETAAQMAYLKRHLCDEVQGFHISQPLPPAELENFLADFRAPAAGEADLDGAERTTLLLVDDEPNILRALTRTLRRDGYRILSAGGAAEAFEVLAQHEVQVILSDQRMPQMCGTDFLSQVKALYPQTVRIVLSGYTDLESVTEAINRGAIYRFLTKPWEDGPLRAHIKEAVLHQRRQRS